jgi:RNA 3'-terminal phosphate cyclase (ATP)
MLTIDGSQGEGGGQILRSALALSLVTATPFRIENIRAGRKKPGLMRQHLTSVQAAAAVGDAQVAGASLGSTQITFEPGTVRGGEYLFQVGTAGSTTLVLQTILPPLLTAGEPSRILIEGGTHNPHAPPFEFLSKTFLPLLARMGPSVQARLERAGFFPAGGGRIAVDIEPATNLSPLDLNERGKLRRIRATAMVALLPRHIAERELNVIRERLGLHKRDLHIEEIRDSAGPGNAVTIEVESEHITEVFTGFGQRGVRAEMVAKNVARQAQEYLETDAPVGEHLADQLLLPLALAGGGSFRTHRVSRHCETNIDVIQRFLDCEIHVEQLENGTLRVKAHRA